MPKYIYINHLTGEEVEITHSMKECKEPSEELLSKITLEDGSVMKRKIVAPILMGFDSLGRSLTGVEKKNHMKADRRKRNHEHYKKEVFPTLPKAEKIHKAAEMAKKGEDISKLEF